MTCSENNESHRSKKPPDLEEWLQLPDSSDEGRENDKPEVKSEPPAGDEPEEQRSLLDEAPFETGSGDLKDPLDTSHDAPSDSPEAGAETLPLFTGDSADEQIMEKEIDEDEGRSEIQIAGEPECVAPVNPEDENVEIVERQIDDEPESVEPDDEESRDSERESVVAEDEEETEDESGIDGKEDEIDRLEILLADEFRDTLTGVNAVTLPIGILFLIIAIPGWCLGFIMTAFRIQDVLEGYIPLASIIAALLTLGGVYLLFYWGVHRISNLVKAGELDRLIESRRWKDPCIHLNCIEIPDEDEQADEGEYPDESAGKGEDFDALSEVIIEGDIDKGANEDYSAPLTDGAFRWHCDLYDVSLDDYPICAVCDQYEAPPDPTAEPGRDFDATA